MFADNDFLQRRCIPLFRDHFDHPIIADLSGGYRDNRTRTFGLDAFDQLFAQRFLFGIRVFGQFRLRRWRVMHKRLLIDRTPLHIYDVLNIKHGVVDKNKFRSLTRSRVSRQWPQPAQSLFTARAAFAIARN